MIIFFRNLKATPWLIECFEFFLFTISIVSLLEILAMQSWNVISYQFKIRLAIHASVVAKTNQGFIYKRTIAERSEIKTCLAITIGNKQSLIRTHLYRPFNINGVRGRGRRTNLHNFNPLTLAVPGIQSNSTSAPSPAPSYPPPPSRLHSLSRVIIKALMTS